MRRMTYEGPPTIFRIDKIANDIGCSVPGGLASLIDLAFFCHKWGFYMVQGGQTITPIGRGKDRSHLLGRVRRDEPLPRLGSDRSGARALYLRLSGQRQRRQPNRLLIYNWLPRSGRAPR